MNFEEKSKQFVNTFQDFTREQQNEVLKQILLKCQVCSYYSSYACIKVFLVRKRCIRLMYIISFLLRNF